MKIPFTIKVSVAQSVARATFASKPKDASSSTRLELYFSKNDLFSNPFLKTFLFQMKQEVHAVAHVKFQVNWLSNTIRIPRYQKVLNFISPLLFFGISKA